MCLLLNTRYALCRLVALEVKHFCFVVQGFWFGGQVRQGLTMKPRLAQTQKYPCLYLSNTIHYRHVPPCLASESLVYVLTQLSLEAPLQS